MRNEVSVGMSFDCFGPVPGEVDRARKGEEVSDERMTEIRHCGILKISRCAVLAWGLCATSHPSNGRHRSLF
jgi:hypothetical protein